MNPTFRKYHQQILAKINSLAPPHVNSWVSERYLGSKHKYYGLSVPQKRKIAKEWVKSHKNIPSKDFFNLLENLFKAESYEEKTIAAAILSYFPREKIKITPEFISNCLECVDGWAEIDSLCYGLLSSEEILNDWVLWESYLQKLSQSHSIPQKRASLVLLTKVVRESDDKRLLNLSLEIIAKLQKEHSILITKAISWLLRDLIRHHKDEVKQFLEKNEFSLPKIALRETRRKIETGKK